MTVREPACELEPKADLVDNQIRAEEALHAAILDLMVCHGYDNYDVRGVAEAFTGEVIASLTTRVRHELARRSVGLAASQNEVAT
ncbi:MAG TPA: hypothetical protein VFT85_05365 [Acidimicrobiia bacterium]|nr:hypothetical protein [Acidimicrobiia bacterium]